LEEAINQGISRMDAYALFAIVIIYMVGKFALHFIQAKKQSPSDEALEKLSVSIDAIVSLANKLNTKGDRILGEVSRVEKKVDQTDKKVAIVKDITLETKMKVDQVKQGMNMMNSAAISGRSFR
jgi:uncharacterized phage infection (PIP) family protein YhgE